jgi:hypothetical protein
MRQRGTWLVVAALAALGLAAAVDALRGGAADPEQPPKQADRTPTTTTGEGVTSGVRLAPETGLDGVLFYTDEDCRLRAIRLPGLRDAEAPEWSQCAFSLSPGGQAAKTSWTVWSPDGAYAADVGNGVEIEPDGRVVRGSMPAWRPDRTLTYVRGGAVLAFPRGRVVLSGADLRRAAMRHPNVPETRGPLEYVRVKQMGWLTPTRAVLLLGVGVRHVGEFDVTAIFEERRLVTTLAAFQSFDRLWTSPGGRFFALGGDGRLELYDRGGRARTLPQLTGPQAIAWSPDDSWAAVATRVSIYVLRMGAGSLGLQRLPIEARDLAWRPAGQAPALGETASLRRWLERAGVVGTLHFSDADCRIRALRVPDVEWSDPVGVRAPCLFSVAPNGTVSDEWIVWQERGPLAVGCHGHSVDVFTSDQQILFHRGDACHPAWKPDGSLTFIARGELILTVRFRRERVLLSREDIAKALGPGMKLEEVAWIDNRQFAAVLRRGPAATLAVFRGRRLVHRPGFSALRIEHLRAGRDMIAALTSGPGPPSVTFFDLAGGRSFALRGHAFAWSPGGTIVAAAGRRRLFFVEPTTGEFRSLQLHAADLAWQ